MADVQLLASGVTPAPLDYVIPGAQEIVIKAVAGSFDGTGAVGSFVPCLQFIAPGGVLAATCPLGSTIAAGASADVTWFPRGGAVAGGVSNSGIFFDTDPQTGDWLRVSTTGQDPTSGMGMMLETTDQTLLLLANNATATVAADDNVQLEPSGNLNMNVGTSLNATVNDEIAFEAVNGNLTINTEGGADDHINHLNGGDLWLMNGDLGSNTNIVLIRDGNTSGDFGVEITAANGNDVLLLADSPSHGSPNTNRWVIVQPNLQLYTFSGEPDAATDDNGAALYLTTPDGGTTVHLKAVFSNGTRVTLASN